VTASDTQPIRARLAEITPESLVLDGNDGRVRLPLAAVQRVDRVGDSVWNGAAIGAALGGVSALAAMAKACSNANCSDTSASLDPRTTLLGALAGAGIGALVDAVVDTRKTVYRAGTDQPPAPASTSTMQPTGRGMVFVRAGWAGLSDDEGSLGSGETIGAGVVVPLGRRFGVQVAYDRHGHRRDFPREGPPGISAGGGGFTGTEQLVTAKTLIFFRTERTVRPYAGLGASWLDSRRVSEFPNYILQPGTIVIAAGPPDINRYHSRDVGLGVAVGIDARLRQRFSILSDLTLDLGGRSGLSSTRLTAGAGWTF
jgi:hypothetical protein